MIEFRLIAIRSTLTPCGECGRSRHVDAIAYTSPCFQKLSQAYEFMKTNTEARRHLYGSNLRFEMRRAPDGAWSGNLFQEHNIPLYDSLADGATT